MLTHDAFELELARVFEHHSTVKLHVFRVDDRRRHRLQQTCQHTFAIQQWRGSEVEAIEVHQVEDVEQHPVRLPAFPERSH